MSYCGLDESYCLSNTTRGGLTEAGCLAEFIALYDVRFSYDNSLMLFL